MLLKNRIKINIPKFPKMIIEELEKNGFCAYIVGGCVRDELLGDKPSDYDITTNAKPEDIKRIFRRTIDTGIKHGTITVLFYEKNIPYTYEVTTYRIDGEYNDGRHPENVFFVDNLKEDLSRRDFTINAMAYNDKDGLVDEFNGIEDLQNKIVRTVGNPIDRFTEDALRLMRAVRFSAKLGFDIEEETRKAIPILSKNLSKISKERIQVELTKILTSDNPIFVKQLFELKLSRYICDSFEDINIGKFDKKLPTHLAYACLFYNLDAEKAKKMLKELRFDNENISKVYSLIYALDMYREYKNIYKKYGAHNIKTDIEIKKMINYLGYDLMFDFIKLIDINDDDKKAIICIRNRAETFKKKNTPIFIKDLNISGDDILKIGFEGKEIGIVLSELLDLVHKNDTFNDKKLLQDITKKVYNIYKVI